MWGPSFSGAAEESPLATLIDGHPRVLLRSEEIDTLRRRMRTDETLQRWGADLRRDAQQILSTEPCRYEIPDGLRLLSVSRKVLQRVRTLALASLLDDDAKCRERCWCELEADGAPVDFWWSLVTRAEIQMRDEGRVLRDQILQPEGGTFSVRPAIPLPQSPHPDGQTANPGVQLLTIQLEDRQQLTLSVLFCPGSEPIVGRDRDRPLADW